jgi:hypothetical protein
MLGDLYIVMNALLKFGLSSPNKVFIYHKVIDTSLSAASDVVPHRLSVAERHLHHKGRYFASFKLLIRGNRYNYCLLAEYPFDFFTDILEFFSCVTGSAFYFLHRPFFQGI